MRKVYLCVIVSFIFIMSGCSKTPMQWLQSDTRAEHLTSAFWSKEHADNTTLWHEATNYCNNNPEKINCSAVKETVMLQTNNTKLAPDGSGHEIWTPK